MSEKLKIIQYTDPMCIWCLALEPVMRTIDYLLKDRVEFQYVLGLLVGDVKQIIGDDQYSEMRFRQLQAQMKEHFLDAGRWGGIPVVPAFGNDTKPEDVNSTPMSLAYKAVQFQNPEVADKFLRRIRECAHNEGKQMARMENLEALVLEFPELDLAAFQTAMQDGSAAKALEKDISECRGKGIRSFPTIQLCYDGQEHWAGGFNDFAYFKNLIEALSGGTLALERPAYSEEEAIRFIQQYDGRVMARELQVLFNLTDTELAAHTEELLNTGLFEKEERGTSYYIREKKVGFCNAETGVCSFS